jgi:thiol-disulfide isomerase/thioredoxin
MTLMVLSKFKERLCLAGLLIFTAACAAKLPTEVTFKRPVGEAKPFNSDAVRLQRLDNETSISIGQYMREQQLKYMVLTFGSQGCAVCMQKARYLQTNLVNSGYSLLGASAKDVIELVGVITDPPGSRADVLSLVGSEGLTHLTWWDPGHNVMMDYFQPEGRQFSVPLTVMVSQTEILWVIPSWQPVTGPELISKIAATLGVDANPPPVDPTQPGDDDLSESRLAKEIPNRFDDVTVTQCSEHSEVKLSSLLPSESFDFRAIVLTQSPCVQDDTCLEVAAKLKAWSSDCQARLGKACIVRQLSTDPSSCQSQTEESFIGGKEFLSVFRDHFNWGYEPRETTPGRWQLPDVVGPLTMIFDAAGRLVFSKEGQIKESLTERVAQDELTRREDGPAFPVWITKDVSRKSVPREELSTKTNFAKIRQPTKYTLVMFWNTWCGSCLEELSDWHTRRDSPLKFCEERPEFCQVVAIETGRAESGLEPKDYLDGLVNGNDDFDGWLKMGWTMPLAVEDLPLASGEASFGWYDGWFRARFGSKEPRNVLYDREGKVMGAWLGLPGEHGPEKALKTLYESELRGP